MALSPQDKAYMDLQVKKGLTADEAWAKLQDVKKTKGLTGGSFMTRAASVAENAPTASPEIQSKATGVKEGFSQMNENIGEASALAEKKKDFTWDPTGNKVIDTGLTIAAGPFSSILPDPGDVKETASSGLGRMKTGVGEIKQSISEDPMSLISGSALSNPKTTEGVADVIGGGIETTFSPVTETIENIPGLNFLMEKMGQYGHAGSEALADKIGDTPEEKIALSKSFDNLQALLMLKYGPKVTEKAISTAKPLINWGGKKLKGAGTGLAEKVLPTTVKEAEMLQKFDAGVSKTRPRTVGETAIERGVAGTQTNIGIKATAAKSKIFTEEVNPALKASTEVITREELFKPLEQKVAETLEPGRKAELQAALDAIKEEYAGPEFDTLTLETAQKIKSGLDEFTPQKSFKGQEIANGYNQLRADMANGIRQQTYNKLADVGIKAKYLDYANLLELEKLGIKARTQKGVALKPGGFATQLRDLWDMAAIPIGTRAGQVLYKVGDFLEFESPKGIKTVGEFIEGQGLTKPEFEAVINESGGFNTAGTAKSATSPNPKSVVELGESKAMNPLIEEAKKYKSAEEFYNSKGTSDSFRNANIRGKEQFTNFWENATKGVDKTPVLDTLNPTGSVLVEYRPRDRATMKLGDNITTLDKTMGRPPDELITIYRGAPSSQKAIQPGDYITTNYDLAKSYAGGGKVLSMEVKMKDVLDDVTEPLGEEYIYRPKSSL